MTRRDGLVAAALLTLAAAIVLWIRLVPLSLPAVPERAAAVVRGRIAARLALERPDLRAPADRRRATDEWASAHPDELAREVEVERARLTEALQYEDAAGRRWPFLGDYDSYLWLRAARNYLRSGTVCDAVIAGECRDTFTLAPVGTAMRYGRSLHTAAIVAVHRLVTRLDPHYPLAASAYLVPVIVGVLGVVPAFAIGRRLAGPFGGFVAAVVGGLHPLLLGRSLGSDNDVWNAVLPLFMVWAIIAALQAPRMAVRILCAALGGAVAGLHAATWRGWTFAWAVVLLGLSGALLMRALRWVFGGRGWRVWQAPPVRAVVVVALAYCAATAACTYVAGAEWAARLGAATPADAPALQRPSTDGELIWPSALSMVSELSVPTLAGITAQSHGLLVFYAAWLGMLLLLLPRRDWGVGHFAVLIGGTLLYRYLLTAGLARWIVGALLFLPLAAAVLVDVRHGESSAEDDAAPGMVIAAWLLAALLMSYEAVRFVLLLAAPLGVAAGVAAGRLHLWLESWVRAQLGTRARLAPILAGAAVLLIALVPIRAGYATAAAYLPAIDRAWADTLEGLRTTAPPDAIVSAWWDYGHWTKYLAERRVSADGSTLLTHAPHWLARAQLAASEQEAVGLLRMLNCGSAAEPYPEGALGAYGKLTRYGLDSRVAYDALVRLASLDRAAADDYLAGLQLDGTARSAVLASTHCTPPASYLLLSSRQLGFPGWWQLGTWDPRRADSAADPQWREAGLHGFATADWVPCVPLEGGGRRCPIGHADAHGGQIDAVVYPEDDARQARVASTTAAGEQSAAPDPLIIVDSKAIETVGGTASADDATAVLLDRERHRVLVGSPAAIGSLYTRLVFLDGRGTTRFRKLDERTGAWGERVITYAIDW